MSAADRLREKASVYDLNARACADRPDAESQMSAPIWAAVALALREVADVLDDDIDTDQLEAA